MSLLHFLQCGLQNFQPARASDSQTTPRRLAPGSPQNLHSEQNACLTACMPLSLPSLDQHSSLPAPPTAAAATIAAATMPHFSRRHYFLLHHQQKAGLSGPTETWTNLTQCLCVIPTLPTQLPALNLSRPEAGLHSLPFPSFQFLYNSDIYVKRSLGSSLPVGPQLPLSSLTPSLSPLPLLTAWSILLAMFSLDSFRCLWLNSPSTVKIFPSTMRRSSHVFISTQ